MKKLILSAALILGSFATFAQTSTTTKTTTTQTIEDKYSEIKLEEIPSSVILALKTAKPEAIVEKAYINDKKEYKLDIKIGSISTSVFTDSEGTLVKK